ncbi:hypothetical protein HYQ45_016475 [Verticillium longisporum]|uniref:Uncharacterized protein n=1 Tax=Verticillium longisporum TaxID=100787 RepID=A0A8I2Z6T2_VERLO|nr:hypothetical protein HYQ45_016475 [Verticillium longisporum]
MDTVVGQRRHRLGRVHVALDSPGDHARLDLGPARREPDLGSPQLEAPRHDAVLALEGAHQQPDGAGLVGEQRGHVLGQAQAVGGRLGGSAADLGAQGDGGGRELGDAAVEEARVRAGVGDAHEGRCGGVQGCADEGAQRGQEGREVGEGRVGEEGVCFGGRQGRG